MNNDQVLLEKLRDRSLYGIIFDFDGTLLDIKPPLKKSIEEVFTEYKIETDIEQTIIEIGSILDSIQGYPIPKILLQSHEIFKYLTVLKEITFLKKLKLAMKIFTRFQTYSSEEAEFFPGTKELISYFGKSCKLYIISHNKTENIVKTLQKERLKSYFDGIYGADVLPALKPNPEALIPPMKKSGNYKGKEWLILGDMPTDIEAGKEAGLYTIGVASGISKKEVLAEFQPDFLVDSLEELLNIIDTGRISKTSAQSSLKIKS